MHELMSEMRDEVNNNIENISRKLTNEILIHF